MQNKTRQKLLRTINLYNLLNEHDTESEEIDKLVEEFTKAFQIYVLNLVGDLLKDDIK
jgi:hypothetical protein